MHINADTVCHAVEATLQHLRHQESGRNIHKDTCAEELGLTMCIRNPAANLIASRSRAFNYRYMIAEMLWNITPTRNILPLSRVLPSITRFTADQHSGKHLVAWAYGVDMYKGLLSVVKELRKADGSRRAVITIHHPSEIASLIGGTPPCLTSVQWLEREGRLDQFVTMRSNDAWRGLPLDLYQFTTWQLFMAAALGLQVGEYHHYAASMHLYAADVAATSDFLGSKTNMSIESTPPDQFAFDQVRNNLEPYLSKAPDVVHRGSCYPWLHTYWGNYSHGAQEFQFLMKKGYGSGW